MVQDDGSVAAVATAIFDALVAALGEDEVDLISDDTGGTIAADDWSLRIEAQPTPIAWLAIDDEPEDSAKYDALRRESMSFEVEGVLAETNRAFGGTLVELLRASGDPFSLALGEALDRQ